MARLTHVDRDETDAAMDVLPDFTTIDDDELKALIERYVREEEEVSYRRRLLHGKIDILRAELVDRVKRRESGDDHVAVGDRHRSADRHSGPPRAAAGPRRRARFASRRVRTASPPSNPGPQGLLAMSYCPECGHHNREAARFCGRCGASLLEPDAGEPTQAFAAYVEEESAAEAAEEAAEGAMLVIRIGGGRAGEQFPIAIRPHGDRPRPERRRVPGRHHGVARARACSTAATTGCTCPTLAA